MIVVVVRPPIRAGDVREGGGGCGSWASFVDVTNN